MVSSVSSRSGLAPTDEKHTHNAGKNMKPFEGKHETLIGKT